MRTTIFAVGVLLSMPVASANAQTVIATAKTGDGRTGPQNVLSIQPLTVTLRAIDVTAYSGEYERAITQRFTLGAGATYWDGSRGDDSVTYTSADLKLRYYPMTTALRGLAIGGSVGFAKAETVTNTLGDETFGGPSVGALVEYQFLIGSFAMALGGGVKSVQVSDRDISTKYHIAAPYPTARFSIGYAF